MNVHDVVPTACCPHMTVVFMATALSHFITVPPHRIYRSAANLATTQQPQKADNCEFKGYMGLHHPTTTILAITVT